ncbi:hypothetical protein M427DRAFT_315925 [Gonapodya prolifera JEL478]|uniref:Endonuclease/exonuclease/phosphatase domain-containing protein n=1 Tax=Gonapodya prolifera (strain JEL478) TaxID=1344416 RepID=A0A139AXY1_GONPJ|nr:hypothetical protein M427DRAFT_315925 [Gonapodya prolifera JEL478]|eukprot:KXS21305.1 hypothetical protein M427DRAFT_315925 [Gonapodya prolifera JEL478]
MTTQTNVKLVTWNAFIRPPPIESRGGDYKDTRLQFWTQRWMNEYDVVCFQELFGSLSSRRASVLENARSFRPPFAHTAWIDPPPWTSRIATDGGLCVASKLPIIAKEQVIYPGGVMISERFCGKGALFVKIALPSTPANGSGRHLYLFITHLHADYTPTPPTTSEDQHLDVSIITGAPETAKSIYKNREKQLEALRDFIHECLNRHGYREETSNTSGDLALLVGDLNSDGLRSPDLNQTTNPEHGWQWRLVEHVLGSSPSNSGDAPRLSLTDIFFERYSVHPVTTLSLFHELPDERKVPADAWHPLSFTSEGSKPSITAPAPDPDEFKSLDYILRLRLSAEVPAASESQPLALIEPRANAFRITGDDRKAFPDLAQTPLVHCSDHAAVEVVIQC